MFELDEDDDIGYLVVLEVGFFLYVNGEKDVEVMWLGSIISNSLFRIKIMVSVDEVSLILVIEIVNC